MATVPSGIAAATVVTTVSLMSYMVFLPLIRQKKKMVMSKRSVLYFVLGGIAGSFGQIFILSAFRFGKVTVVTPLAGTTPVFVLFMTYLFLRETERINFLVVVGIISIFAGVVILSSTA